MEHWKVTKIWVYQTFTIEFSILLNVFFLSPARLCWQLWGTSWKFMKLQQYIRKTTTSKEKVGKFQRRCTQTSQFWGSLQKRLQNTRQEAKKRQLWKGFSCTCKANSWPIPVNMWLSTEVRIWVFNDDIWRKSIFVVWSGYDTVWSKLQPSSNLWCIMSCKRIRL